MSGQATTDASTGTTNGADGVGAGEQLHGGEPVEVPDHRHATSWLWERESSGDPTHVVRFPVDADGEEWAGLDIAELAARVRGIAAGLISSGVERGDRVAVMAPTSIDWTLTDLAVLAAGAVTVPVYETSSAEQAEWILSDSGAVLALAGDAEAAELLEGLSDSVREVLDLSDGALDDLAERGAGSGDDVDQRCTGISGDDVATMVYTSGTTGKPKGCPITHRNLVWTAAQARAALDDMLGEEESNLMFLPLAHVFARVVQFVCFEASVQLGYARSIDDMREDIVTFRPTFLLAVPRVFQKIHAAGRRQATGLRRPVFDFAVRTAQKWSRDPDPGAFLRLRHRLADALVYSRLRSSVGGRVRYCVSGGAPLAPHLAEFFHAAGITILEGYGLTETTAPVTVNRPDAFRFGTVGRPLPGVDIRLADDGEVVVRGGNVISGYHQRPEDTEEDFEDGWFHTGDVGSVDDDGFLRILDRKKELIVTESGKNVAPSVLEERLKSSSLVSQAMVIGDGQPFIAALVTLDADEREIEGDPNDDGQCRRAVERAVEHANEAVSHAESIREFVILDREFSEDRDEVTPTMKLKRDVILDHHREVVDSIYDR